jgi:hypothetical protein
MNPPRQRDVPGHNEPKRRPDPNPNPSRATPKRRTKKKYPGASNEKRGIRLAAYLAARRILGEGKFREGLHLILASQEGGDAFVLKTLGVPGRGIRAFDMKGTCVEAFLKKHPDVSCQHAEASAWVAQHARFTLFDTINFDICGTLRDETLGQFQSLAKHVRMGGVLMATIIKGRDEHRGEGSRLRVFERVLSPMKFRLVRETTYRGNHVGMLNYFWVRGGRSKRRIDEIRRGFGFEDCLEFAKATGQEPAGLLGLTRGQLAARKAHLTRGTYGTRAI